MNNIKSSTTQTPAFDVNPIVEPLASFICAAEEPVTVLKLAIAALYRQIEQTNRTANAHLETLLEGRLTVSA